MISHQWNYTPVGVSPKYLCYLIPGSLSMGYSQMCILWYLMSLWDVLLHIVCTNHKFVSWCRVGSECLTSLQRVILLQVGLAEIAVLWKLRGVLWDFSFHKFLSILSSISCLNVTKGLSYSHPTCRNVCAPLMYISCTSRNYSNILYYKKGKPLTQKSNLQRLNQVAIILASQTRSKWDLSDQI